MFKTALIAVLGYFFIVFSALGQARNFKEYNTPSKQHIEDAQLLNSLDKWQDAISTLKRVQPNDSLHRMAFNSMLGIYLQREKPAEVVKEIKNPEYAYYERSIFTQIALAEANIQLGNIKEAETFIKTLDSIYPFNYKRYTLRAAIAQKQNNPQLQLQFIKKAIEIAPLNSHAHIALAKLYEEKNKLTAAIITRIYAFMVSKDEEAISDNIGKILDLLLNASEKLPDTTSVGLNGIFDNLDQQLKSRQAMTEGFKIKGSRFKDKPYCRQLLLLFNEVNKLKTNDSLVNNHYIKLFNKLQQNDLFDELASLLFIKQDHEKFSKFILSRNSIDKTQATLFNLYNENLAHFGHKLQDGQIAIQTFANPNFYSVSSKPTFDLPRSIYTTYKDGQLAYTVALESNDKFTGKAQFYFNGVKTHTGEWTEKGYTGKDYSYNILDSLVKIEHWDNGQKIGFDSTFYFNGILQKKYSRPLGISYIYYPNGTISMSNDFDLESVNAGSRIFKEFSDNGVKIEEYHYQGDYYFFKHQQWSPVNGKLIYEADYGQKGSQYSIPTKSWYFNNGKLSNRNYENRDSIVDLDSYGRTIYKQFSNGVRVEIDYYNELGAKTYRKTYNAITGGSIKYNFYEPNGKLGRKFKSNTYDSLPEFYSGEFKVGKLNSSCKEEGIWQEKDKYGWTQQKINYADGAIINQTVFYPTSSTKVSECYPQLNNGDVKKSVLNLNQDTISQVRISGGNKVDYEVKYYRTGSIKEVENYNDEKVIKKFYSSGKLKEYSQKYNNADYVTAVYDTAGNFSVLKSFELKNGLNTIKWPNGKVWKSMEVSKMLVNGVAKTYYANGNIYHYAEQKMGRYINIEKYFDPFGRPKTIYEIGHSHKYNTLSIDTVYETEDSSYHLVIQNKFNPDTSELFFYSVNQKPLYSMQHVNGKINGCLVVYAGSEKPIGKVYYLNNQVTHYTQLNPDGTPKPQGQPVAGKDSILIYHPNNKIGFQLTLFNGVANGKFSLSNAEGVCVSEIELVANKVHGLSRSWYENGQLAGEHTSLDGDRTGKAIGFYPNGKVRFEINYLENMYHGPLKWYTPSGRLRAAYNATNNYVE